MAASNTNRTITTLLLLSVLLLTLIESTTAQMPFKRYYSYQYGGTQLIDPEISYMNNLRYSEATKTFYFRSDKSHPNVFTAYSTGPDPHDFYIPVASEFSDTAPPALSFDVASFDGIDYVIGSSYGESGTPKFGLPIELLSPKSGKEPFSTVFPGYYFYDVVLDTKVKPDGANATAYFIGFEYADKTNRGIIVARAHVYWGEKLKVEFISSNVKNINLVEADCYDIWDELHKPSLYIDPGVGQNGLDRLVIAIPGRCSILYGLDISEDPLEPLKNPSGPISPLGPNPTGDVHVVSYSFRSKDHRLFFTIRTYNTPGTSISSLKTDTFTLEDLTPFNVPTNSSNPVLQVDPSGDIIYLATSGMNKILALKKTSDNYEEVGSAVLAENFRDISEMLVVDGFVYFVTWEPNAVIGRIPQINFCSKWCGNHGFCNGATSSCGCLPEYEQNPDVEYADCIPKFVVELENEIKNNAGATTTLSVFLGLTLGAAALGWFLYYRIRKGYSTA
eukprot:TRINITY_DN11176_c0_g1_i1.p1 TRINITY_DN11176_c0_g1~~TRINITY_DN11176_c0_g1_i1.p1  ORF type:complete len:523 (-),score=117.36 TRINITY_DN11176_c0_g1_i1:30-1541(-)